jgi:CDP-paratose synthetase
MEQRAGVLEGVVTSRHSRPRLLVLGGAGFVGSAVVHELYRDYETLVVARSNSDLSRLADIRSAIDVVRLPANPNELFSTPVFAVLNLAVNYGRCETERAEVALANFLMPKAVYETAVQHGCDRFVNADTYYRKMSPNSRYLWQYRESKDRLREWLNTRGDASAIHNLALEHVYGEDDSEDKFIPRTLDQMIRNQPRIELTKGEQQRDFVHVADVARAFRCAVQSPAKPGFCDVEIGTGEMISLRSFIELMHQISTSASQLDFGAIPYRDGELMQSVADVRAAASLGWAPTIDVVKGAELLARSARRRLEEKRHHEGMFRAGDWA